jgi:sterol carrier protein 2
MPRFLSPVDIFVNHATALRVAPRHPENSMSNPTKVFEDMNARITQEKAKKINSTYLFDIGGDDGGKWFADLTRTEGPYIEQKDGDAKCTITVPKSEDWVAIASGKMNPTSAFMQGKIKVKGDMSMAMKLQTLLS